MSTEEMNRHEWVGTGEYGSSELGQSMCAKCFVDLQDVDDENGECPSRALSPSEKQLTEGL